MTGTYKDPDYRRKYAERNREQIREYKARWREENIDAIRAKQAAYHQANRERRNAYNRAYHAANRERLNAAGRAYREANPDKWQAYQRANGDAIRAQQRQHRLFAKHGLLPETWAVIWQKQGGRCYLCGDELTGGKAVAVDHDHSHCAAGSSCAACRRGIACSRCNTLIGLAADDPERLRQIADNLEAAKLTVTQRVASAGEQLTLLAVEGG